MFSVKELRMPPDTLSIPPSTTMSKQVELSLKVKECGLRYPAKFAKETPDTLASTGGDHEGEEPVCARPPFAHSLARRAAIC